MGKHFFDYDDGDFAHTISDHMPMDSDGDFLMRMGDNMAMDSDGNMMMRMGNNMAMDMDSGDIHFISSWSADEEDDG